MEQLRKYLSRWGIVLNRTTLGISLCVLVTCAAVFTFVLFPAWGQYQWVRILLVLLAIPGLAILFGSLYRPTMWDISDKKGRTQIEKETAIKILQDHYKEENARQERERRRIKPDPH
jgi:hypothetical protein